MLRLRSLLVPSIQSASGLRFAAASAILAITFAPAPRAARADEEGGAPANVSDATMLVDAKTNGKDTWSPGGKELRWSVSKCPFKIQFKAVVTVDKPTKVTYRWERSNGDVLSTQTFEVKTAGAPVEITPVDAWTVGMAGQTFRGAETLHVLTPSDMSTTTPIRVECGG